MFVDAFSKCPIVDPEESVKETSAKFHRFTINLGLKYGKVFAPSSKIEGVSIWLPPGYTKISTWKSINSGILTILSISSKSRNERRKFYDRIKNYSRYSSDIHKKYAPFPHWYLLSIGIREQYRGKGFASRLLKPLFQEFDHEKVPCYLETHNPENVELYKHFGFKIVDDGKIPGTEKTHWAMLRKWI